MRSQGGLSLAQTLEQDAVRPVANVDGLEARQLFGRDDREDVEIDVGVPPEHVFQDGFGVDQCADHDGDVRLLCDLKRAVAEREQVFFGAVRACLLYTSQSLQHVSGQLPARQEKSSV